MIDQKTIQHIAKLARLKISTEDAALYSDQLIKVLSHFQKISEINTDGVEPLVTPSEILDAVNIWLTESLHQTMGESAVKDGMDVALIAIHKHSNEVLFAGANNPIYIVSHGELKQIKGDKFPVGAFVEDQIQKFTTKRFMVEKGDSIYLFSDGYADQFGGDKGKKYKYSPFQQKLKEITDLSLTEQSNKMKQEFLEWKGAHGQVDDVLLIGIKIV